MQTLSQRLAFRGLSNFCLIKFSSRKLYDFIVLIYFSGCYLPGNSLYAEKMVKNKKLTLMARFRKLKNVKNSLLNCDKFYEEKSRQGEKSG